MKKNEKQKMDYTTGDDGFPGERSSSIRAFLFVFSACIFTVRPRSVVPRRCRDLYAKTNAGSRKGPSWDFDPAQTPWFRS